MTRLIQQSVPTFRAALLVVGLVLFGLASNSGMSVQAQSGGTVVVSNTRLVSATENSASITWDTNLPTCAQVNYGLVPGSLNLQVIETGCSPLKTTGHTMDLTNLQANRTYYYQVVATCSSCVTGVSPQLSFSTSSTDPLTISDINVTSIGPNSATITWTTNKDAAGQVFYGLTQGYELGLVQEGRGYVTAHSVPLLNLQPNTTYHFQVGSSTPPPANEGVQSTTDRTFVTSSGAAGGSLPTITLGPRVDATNTQAVVTFSTNVDTAALVEYERTPNTVVDQLACDNAQNCAAPPPQPVVLATNHTVVLTGLTQPSAQYRYRVTIIDASRSVFQTSYFTFNSSASGDDHVFTTGGCNDGTPINQCNAAGQYCRPGGGDPVFDCRPGIACPAQCNSGSTCQASGDCTQDPTLTGIPTQCNQTFCYQHCDQNSGSRSGLACTDDADCTASSSSGKCVTGTFNNPAVAGCYASWPACNANVILKVSPDRVCDKWMTCKTSLPVTDSSGKTQNQCFDLTICNSLSPSGQCNSILEGGQCDNDPLRFCETDADCLNNGVCRTIANGGPLSLTYNTPSDVGKIQNLTGFARAGLDWGNNRIEGRFPYSLAQQTGSRIDIPDADFEDFRYVGRCRVPVTSVSFCDEDADCNSATGGTNTCQLTAETGVVVQQIWEGATGDELVQAGSEGNANTLNNFLAVTPTDQSGSGARMTNSARFITQSNEDYLLSVRLRSTQNGQPIRITLSNDSNTTEVMDDGDGDGVVKVGTSWQTFRVGPVAGPGGQTKISFLTTVTGDPVTFYVDDLQMLPALKVNNTTLISQSCRVYPGEDSPKCDYTDPNGVIQSGLKGFCLERDPLNAAVCLSWWPVDILSGSNIFSQDQAAGYSGRRPVYACAENLGLARVSGLGTTCNPPMAPSNCSTTGFGIPTSCGCVGAGPGYTYGSIRHSIPDQAISVDPNILWSNSATRHTLVSTQPEYHLPEPAVSAIELIGYGYSDNGSGGDCTPYGWPRDMVFTADEFNAPTGTVRNYCGINYKASRSVQSVGGQSRIVWSIVPTCTDGHQCLTAFYLFNESTGELEHMLMDGADRTGDDPEGAAYFTYFHVNEMCTKLVQVVGPTQDSAWVDRTSNTSTYVVPDLNYRQVSDYRPFGGSVLPDASTTPDLLPAGYAVSSQGADTSLSDPYQVRSGAVYACNGNCSVRQCDETSGTKRGSFCVTSSDCIDSSTPPATGLCVGGGLCMTYNASTNSYSLTGNAKACTATSQCASGEECVGGAASSKGAQSFSNVITDANSRYSQYRIQRLFAEGLSVWQWNVSTRHYEDVTATAGTWVPPTTLCQVCSGSGATAGKACTSDASCGAGSTCEPADRHPSSNADQTNDSGADYCAIKPTVTNINDGQSEVTISEGGLLILKFNVHVDREQLPITRVTIDWGDGSSRTQDTNLRIAPKEDPANPHAYTHTYHCSDVRCEYFPKIQIEDNWKWCSDGTYNGPAGCNTNPNSTTFPWAGGLKVVVE